MTKKWKKKLVPGIAIAVVSLGLLGAATYALAWDPDETHVAAPNDVAAGVTVEELAEASGHRVFFGHMSVGRNILSGITDVHAAKGVAPPAVIEIESGEMPVLPEGGVLVHALIGENYHPLGKLKNFDETLRAGLGDEVDVALLKFCYLDVSWYTDVNSLFAEYRGTMDALESDYPDVRFVHVTVPLTVGPYGIKDHLKVVLGRDNNVAREEFNELMRAAYDPENLLDIAAMESTAPDGSVVPEMYSGYTSDGSHLNETGSAMAAVKYARLLNGKDG